MKIVINTCFGGFSLSKQAYEALGLEWDGYGYDYNGHSKRTDHDLVRVVEELGENANGIFAKLRVIEIPDDVEFHIEEYDGAESIDENHRTWG